MISNARSTVLLLRKCGLLLLALSVFGFGLQARLAQYKPCPPNPTAAKISTEKHSARALQVLAERDKAPRPADRLASATFFNGARTQLIPPSASERARIELCDPRKLDANHVYSLHGPPSILL